MIDLNKLSAYPHQREAAAGQRAAKPGGPKEMYIVLSGTFEAYVMQNGTLASAGSYGPGESFGAKEYFSEGAQEVFLAREPSRLCVVTEETFPELARLCPEAAFSMLRDAYAPPRAVKAVQTAPPKPEPPKAEPPAAPKPQPPAALAKPAPTAAKTPFPSGRDTGGASVKALSPDFFPEGHKGYPGIVRPEYEQFVYDKEYKCPNCQKSFKGKKIFQSKLSVAGPLRYDMRESFVNFQTEWYDVVCCPHCYFSMLSNYFVDPKNFVRPRAKEALAEAYEKVALDFTRERDIEFVMATHYLALAGTAGFVNRVLLSARLWAYLSWLYEDVGDREMEKYAASKAAQGYINLFSETTISPTQEQTVCLTIAGMLYRAEEPADIKKWLYNVKSNREGKRMYIDLADNLLELIKEE